MLAERILQYDRDRRFSDILELCLYNAVLTAMSHDGTKFTYVNQLASSDRDPSKREEWFTCACCPPNVLRLMGQIGGYIYTEQAMADTLADSGPDSQGQQQRQSAQINVHLYISSQYEFQVDGAPAVLTQKGDWPWSGKVEFELQTTSSSSNVSLALRIPGWAKSWKVSRQPKPKPKPKHSVEMTKGVTNKSYKLPGISVSANNDISR